MESLSHGEQAVRRWGGALHVLAPLWVPLCGNLAAVCASLHFFDLPTGAPVRALAWAGLLFTIAAATALLGAPIAIAAVVTGRKRREVVAAGLFGLAMSLTPFFIGMAMLHLAAGYGGFTLAD